MDWIYKKLIGTILGWLTGESINFDKVLSWVRTAELKFTAGGGAEKAAWVKEQIRSGMDIAIPFILNLLVELAVAYAKKQGMIR